MYLKGNVKDIEAVEKEIRQHTLYFKGKDGSGKFQVGNEHIKSAMFCRQYYVDVGWGLAGVKLVFDYRDKTGEVRVKDGHLQKLIRRVPSIGKALEPLRPFYNAGSYQPEVQPYAGGGKR